MLRKYGISDTKQLKRTLARRSKALELQRQRDTSLQQLAGRLGECLTLDELQQELENGDFETRLQRLEGEQQQVAAAGVVARATGRTEPAAQVNGR